MMMLNGGDQQRMSIDNDIKPQVPLNYGALIPYDSSVENVQNEGQTRMPDVIANRIKILEDDMLESALKLKHHEDNIKYLQTLKIQLDESISDYHVALKKFDTKLSISGLGDNAHVDSEKETIQNVVKYEKSAAAFVCSIKSEPSAQDTDHPFMKDVVGIVATLGKVEDDNLSRMLSEYLGVETMLGVVCKTNEGVKALETYNKDDLINTSLGLHAFASSTRKPFDGRFNVFCLENLRPYPGELIADDPQRKLNIQNPRSNMESPPGFLGFAVNMVSVDYHDLHCVTRTGHSLRETLFYNLFSTLQVYKCREDMIKALPFITNGAVSLDGGIVRSPGLFSLGHHQEIIDVKFPSVSKVLPEGYLEIQKQMKEATWKKDQIGEDLQREEALLEHAKLSYDSKRNEFLQFSPDKSAYTPQGGGIPHYPPGPSRGCPGPCV